MGVVYLGHHEHLDRPVAVKVLLPGSDDTEGVARRFRREVRALGKIRSPYVAEAYDADLLDSGELYLVMEYLDGRDLRAELRKRGSLPMGEAVAYVMQASRGAAAAHRAGIIHRDLNPRNMFLAKAGGVRQAKLVDFGIARFLGSTDAGLTQVGDTLGTPLYMSPEQIFRPSEVDARGDVWQLGVILYELLAGFPAFGDQSPGAILVSVALDDPVPLTEVNPAIPGELEHIVNRALAKDPACRLSRASHLADLLAPFAVPEDQLKEVVSASPQGPSLRLPLPRRKRAVPSSGKMMAYPTPDEGAVGQVSSRPEAVAGSDRASPGGLMQAATIGDRHLSLLRSSQRSLTNQLRASLPPSFRQRNTIRAGPVEVGSPRTQQQRQPPRASQSRARWAVKMAVVAIALGVMGLGHRIFSTPPGAQLPSSMLTSTPAETPPLASPGVDIQQARDQPAQAAPGESTSLNSTSSPSAPPSIVAAPRVTRTKRSRPGVAPQSSAPAPRVSPPPAAGAPPDGNPLHL